MTQPVQEPSQGRTDQAQGFRTRQLFRRPAPLSVPRTSGWTVAADQSDLLTLDFNVIIPVPREFSGWLLYDVDASLYFSSTYGDVEIGIDRIRQDGVSTTSITAILSTLITIEEGELTSRIATVPPVVANGVYLLNEDTTPAYDNIFVYVNSVGNDAYGLMLNLAIGVEQPPGSGTHTP